MNTTKTKKKTTTKNNNSPIAIIGIGCRFPGEINSPVDFWRCLSEGNDGTGEVPTTRWNLDAYFDENPGKNGKVYARRGGFLKDIDGFDPMFFGISPREAAAMDPQQRLLLEVTWEAFEDGGLIPAQWAGDAVGVYVGLFTHDFENLHMRQSEYGEHGLHSATGMSTTISANRISHAFDFKGPSMIIDTACSSSLVAIHLACQSLQAGETKLAVAGGVNLQIVPEMTMMLSQASMLSPDGRSKSFDARANGYARADGVGMIALKTLDEAVAAGDPIYAVIRGSAVNQDGRTKGITVPNGDSQKEVIRTALKRAGIAPGEVQYLEAHGTGTPVGDPIEAHALGSVFSEGRPEGEDCLVGSVKSNFGHAESAAGVAGLIKVALMLKHQQVPPNLHFETPNPDIPFESLHLRVPTKLEPWLVKKGHPRLAGLNSFGFGGTNAHLVVEGVESREEAEPSTIENQRPSLLCLSARSGEALREMAEQYSTFLTSEESCLRDAAYAAAIHRQHHPHRLTIAARTNEECQEKLAAFLSNERRLGVFNGEVGAAPSERVAFIFSGMGQQWWAMGRGLMESEPLFAAKIEEIAELFRNHTTDWSLLDILSADEKDTRIDETQFAQPAIFALQVALAALWRSWGVEPQIVVGHSVGELAAAHISGTLSLKDAIRVCFHRSRLQATTAGRGKMLAVGLTEAEASFYLSGQEEHVAIAAVNSPSGVTLSGETEALERIERILELDEVFARFLKVDVPYHSPVMDEIIDELEASIDGIAPHSASIPIVSTVTGLPIDGKGLGASYWPRNVREPVAFAKALETVMNQGCDFFIEIGTHPVLATSINECLATAKSKAPVIASLRRNEDDGTVLVEAAGQLHCSGYPLDFERLLPKTGQFVRLPTYPWQRNSYWTESEESKTQRTGIGLDNKTIHPLLGRRMASALPTWQATIGPNHPGYLSDHKVRGTVVFPAAGYIEMALAAGRELHGSEGALLLEDVKIENPLILDDSSSTSVQLVMEDEQRFSIYSQPSEQKGRAWTRHATGLLIGTTSEERPNAIELRQHDELSKADGYQRFIEMGLEYGPQFQHVEAFHIGSNEVFGRLEVPDSLKKQIGTHILHPAVLDNCFQLMAALPLKGTFLPVGLKRLRVWDSPQNAFKALAQVVSTTTETVVGDIQMTDDDGNVLAEVSGFTCRHMADPEENRKNSLQGALYDFEWRLASNEDTTRQAQHLPNPNQLASKLEVSNNRNHRQERAAYYANIRPALDALTAGYFAQSLTSLGWQWQKDEEFSTTGLIEQLGIAPRHERLTERILSVIAEAGVLERHSDSWLTRTLPETGSLESSWNRLLRQHPEFQAELTIMERCGNALADVLIDAEEPLSLLFPQGSLIMEHLYQDSPSFHPYNRILAEAVGSIVAELPKGQTLRILEIGGGTGGVTSLLLPLLPPSRTEYVFTDISASFFKQARAKFQAYPFLQFETLDIEKLPADQDFDLHTFDLIIASDVLHATADLKNTISNVSELLSSQGMVLLLELTDPPYWFDLVFGMLPGWWLFNDHDLRPNHATLTRERWTGLLGQCGYNSIETVGDRVDGQPSLQEVILARGPEVSRDGQIDKVATASAQPTFALLPDSQGVADALKGELEKQGQTVVVVEGGTLPSIGSLTIDGRAPLIVDLRTLSTANDKALSQEAVDCCLRTMELVQTTAGENIDGLWVITNGAQCIGDETNTKLSQAPLWGFGRVVMTEHGDLNTTLIDLSTSPTPDEISELCRELLSRSGEEEVALRGGQRYIHRAVIKKAEPPADGSILPFELRQTGQRQPNDLAYFELPERKPGPGQVRLDIRASGVNFKDFAKIAGLLDDVETLDGSALGHEGAGVITAVGEGVENLQVGDSVMGLIHSSFSSTAITEAQFLTKKPKRLSFEAAAGIPITFLTAYHALHRHARLQQGERVLIHTGASGVGMAAIEVARHLGAEIYATAGTPEKRAFLNALGLAYVGDSRTDGFVKEIQAVTAGQGVDVVLSTLPPKLTEASLTLLKAATGQMIDIRNLHYGASLQMQALERGISFSAFDLESMSRANPEHIESLLEELTELMDEGILNPAPFRSRPSTATLETLHGVRGAQHMGKWVLSYGSASPAPLPTSADIKLNGDATYLITGGLGGFGLATARWLASNGARNLVLIGRRGAASPEAQEAIPALEAAGVNIKAVAGDVSDRRVIEDVLADIRGTMPPLRGVIHAAMVLRDMPIKDLTENDLQDVLKPKLLGAWHLHETTQEEPLDFFISYSSIANLIGNTGQSAYGAANEFLEQLARLRQARGLPALTIGWGSLDKVGYVARTQDAEDTFLRQGVKGISPNQAWQAIVHGLRTGVPYLAAALVEWETLGRFSTPVATSLRYAELPRAIGHGRAGAVEKEGAASEPQDRDTYLIEQMGKEVAWVLGVAPDGLDHTKPLSTMGFDSLMGVELSVAIETTFGVALPRMALLRPDLTTADLIQTVGEKWTDAAPVSSPQPIDETAIDVNKMSDEEVQAELERLLAEGGDHG